MDYGTFSYFKSRHHPALTHSLLGLDVGIVGIILAVPILAAFKIFCAHIKPMEPLRIS
jgi:hypothetical protein